MGINWRDDPVSDKQRGLLEKWGIAVPTTKGEAHSIISAEMVERRNAVGLPYSPEDEHIDWEEAEYDDPWEGCD